jgi:hypothetical protein
LRSPLYGTAREGERSVSSGFDYDFDKPLDIYRLRATLGGITAERS